jgi:hypothetical protein
MGTFPDINVWVALTRLATTCVYFSKLGEELNGRHKWIGKRTLISSNVS